MGILPIHCIIQKNTINMFRNILTNKDSVEYQVVERQLIMKDCDEISWINEVKTLDLPTAYELLENPPTKER